MVTFGKAHGHTSRKCVVVQGMNFKKSIHFCFRIIASYPVWLENNSLELLISEVFLAVREPLVTTFSETCAVASPKDIIKQGMKISKSMRKA